MRTLTLILFASLVPVVAGCSGGTGSAIPVQTAQTAQTAPQIKKYSTSEYKLVDLGANFSPSRVNAKNAVAGTIGQALKQVAAVYANGKITPFPAYPGQTASSAADINDSGAVVGRVYLPEGSQTPFGCQHAALFHSGAPPTIYYTCAYGAQSYATGINNSGEIVGSASPGECSQTAIFSGSTTLLASNGLGEPASVNKTGTIAGTIFDAGAGGCSGGGLVPTTFDPSATVQLPPDATPPYSTAVNSGGWATDINDKGTVVGSYLSCISTASGSCGVVGFVYAAGTTTPVYEPNVAKTSGCVALTGLNNGGDTVGSMGVVQGQGCASTVAIIVVHGIPKDLNTLISGHPHWHLASAADVNDGGVIVGSGTKNGVQHGFMLVPKFCSLPAPRR